MAGCTAIVRAHVVNILQSGEQCRARESVRRRQPLGTHGMSDVELFLVNVVLQGVKNKADKDLHMQLRS